MRNSNKRSKRRHNSSIATYPKCVSIPVEETLLGKMTINSVEDYLQSVRWNLMNMVEDANTEYLEALGVEERSVVDHLEREWRVSQQLVLELDEAYGYLRKFFDHIRMECLAFDSFDEDGNPKIQGDVPKTHR